MLEKLERFEAVEAIKVGIAAAEKGHIKPAHQALADLGEKLGLQH